METNEINRLNHEISHGKKLSEEGAESVWNWSSPAGQKRADRRAAYIVSVGRVTSQDNVLEIGCGTGLFTKKVSELTQAPITAIDLSYDLLDIARSSSNISNVKFLYGDAMSMEFGDKEFDVVFGSSILHHLNFEKSLQEMFRVLKPAGRIVFAEPNMLNPQIFIQKNIPFIKERLGDSPDETAVVRWKLAKQLKRIGFVNIRIFPYDFLHPVTPRAFISVVDGIGRVIEKIPVLREIAGSVIIYAEKPNP